jgi:hypothetical protein
MKGERQEQDARVAAAVCGLTRRVAERERQPADDPEDDEVRAVILEMGVELRPKQQRHQADERQRGSENHDG